MTEHKFEVGETVWVPGEGWQVLAKSDPATDACNYPLCTESHSYMEDGREWRNDKYPVLLTVEQAKLFSLGPPT